MKSTKRSLLLSALSLILCVTMLLGTTYAWFTDSVSSGKNQIVAGNLDVELYANGAPVTTETKLFDAVELWEPGAAAYETLQVKNVGNLALKYRLSLLFENETKVGDHGLSEALKVGFFEGTVASGATREEVVAKAAGSWQSLATFTKNGKLEGGKDDKAVTYVIWWEPKDNAIDNLFNMNNGNQGEKLSIDFWVKLEATQLASEKDSFDEFYDAPAPWLGGVDAVPAEEDGVITIRTSEQLAGLAKSINEGTRYTGKTIKLASDLDLNNVEWPGIDTEKTEYAFTFDGNGKTIKNLKISATGSAGLFVAAPSCTIKNLTIDGASVASSHYAAAIVGHGLCTKVENCTVKNAAIVSTPVMTAAGTYDDGDKAGAIVGYLSGESVAYVKNCTVSDTTIAAFRDLGAFTGMANGTAEVSNNKIGNNVKLSYIFVAPYVGGKLNENLTDYAGRIAATATVADNNEGTAIKGEANSLSTPADLKMLATAVNGGFSFAGQTVKLANDIDCEDADMLPIGTLSTGRFSEDGKEITASFNGTLDGNGKTVKNAKIKGTTGVGFIGMLGGGELKNVILDDVHATGVDQVAVLVGYTASGSGKVTGCTVKNSSANGVMRNATDDSANNIAALIGYIQPGGGQPITLTGNTFTNVTVTGYRNLGTLVGRLNGNADPEHVVISNNTATDITLVQDLTLNGNPKNLDAGAKVGAYVGDYLGSNTLYLTDIESNNNVTLKSEQAKLADGVFFDILTGKLFVGGVDAGAAEIVANGLLKQGSNYLVFNGAGLAEFNARVAANTAVNHCTLKLLADIDMAGKTWKTLNMGGIADVNHSTIDVFDGQNHKISNITVTGTPAIEAFGMFYVVGTDLIFKDLTIDNAVIDTEKQKVGVLVGEIWQNTVTFDNVTVTNANIKGNSKMGTLVGQITEEATGKAIVKDCTIDGIVMEASRKEVRCGGVAGWVCTLNAANGSIEFQGANSVTNVTIKGDDPEALKAKAYIYDYPYKAEDNLVNYPAN